MDEIAYAAHWNQYHQREEKAKELYSMLDQLYVFEEGMSKEEIVLKIKNAYLRDKVINASEYQLVKQYAEKGYIT